MHCVDAHGAGARHAGQQPHVRVSLDQHARQEEVQRQQGLGGGVG